MGSGVWDVGTYNTVSARKIASGTNMAYSRTMASAPVAARKAHADLSVKDIKVRESRDSDEHPNAVPVAVFFDVTGSMGRIPTIFQQKFKELFSLLLRKGYLEDPQVLMGAVGDVWCDRVPFQAGQFESDNRVDDELDNIYLEGGGGGNAVESYDLALYFLGHKTSTDAWEKRSKKGYAFIIGDELCNTKLSKSDIAKVFGDTPEADIKLEDLITKAQEKWDLYVICPTRAAGASYDAIVQSTWWSKYIDSENVLVLESADAVAELIAATIGTGEGIDLADVLDDLDDIGSTAGGAVGNALAKRSSGGSVAVADAPADLDVYDQDTTDRL